MNQLSEIEFRDAIIATRKDAKLVAAAKNDRTNSAPSLYKEFQKLPVERQREILIAIASDNFVAAQWRIAFPLNNFPAAVLPDAVAAAGKALFFARDEASVREVIRAINLYQQTPFVKQIATLLGDAAEIEGENVARVADALTSTEVFGLLRTLDPTSPASEKIITTVVRVATYTRDKDSTLAVAKFLHSRRESPILAGLTSILENAIFLARDRKSVKEILTGFNAGGIDAVLMSSNGNKKMEGEIRDFAWKSRSSKAIREYLESIAGQ